MGWMLGASALLSGGGSILGGILGSGAAEEAATQQVAAAGYAANLQNQAANRAMDINQQQWFTNQAQLAPWLQTGQRGLNALSYGLGLGTQPTTQQMMGANPQAFAPPQVSPEQARLTELQNQIAQMRYDIAKTGETWSQMGPIMELDKLKKEYAALSQKVSSGQITAPTQQAIAQQPMATQAAGPMPVGEGELLRSFTTQDFQQDPGYAFRQSEGLKGINASAAARGGALSGGAVREAERFASGLASQEYGNAWNRFQSDQTNRFNRLAAIAGIGQTSANTLGQFGQNYAGNAANIGMTNAANTGELALQASNARASGYMGSANAWSNALAGAGNALGNYAAMRNIFPQGNLQDPRTGTMLSPTLKTI